MATPVPVPAPAPTKPTIGQLLQTKSVWAGIIGGIGPIFTGISKLLAGDHSGFQDILTGVAIALGALGLRGALGDIIGKLAA